MGCRFGAESRFKRAFLVLDQVVQSDGSAAAAGQSEVLPAIELARDIIAVVDAMPSNRVADFRKDLETCGRGPLVPFSTDYQPVQAQSQLLVRAAFQLAGADPSQPTHSGSGGRKKPDILLENGLSTYGVEVKRPTLARNAVPRARDASDQLLGAGLPGGIVVDVTDALRDREPEACGSEVIRLAHEISAEFFVDGIGWKPGCRHVMLVAVMARPSWRLMPVGKNDGQVQVHSVSCAVALGTAHGTLDTIRSHWMRRCLNTGLNALNSSPTPPEGGASA
jgi:hypothetical protein